MSGRFELHRLGSLIPGEHAARYSGGSEAWMRAGCHQNWFWGAWTRWAVSNTVAENLTSRDGLAKQGRRRICRDVAEEVIAMEPTRTRRIRVHSGRAVVRPSSARARRHAVVALTASLLLLTPVTIAVAATVNGSTGPDKLRGTVRADTIHAGAADDRVHALAGNDDVYGGPGDDLLLLGPGADFVHDSYRGSDTVYGGRGNDTSGGAHAWLGAGADRYIGDKCVEAHLGAGNDSAPSRNTNDWGATGSCTLYAGPGQDWIMWGGTDAPHTHNADRLVGGAGADYIRGGYNDDTLVGGDGPDLLYPDEAMTPDTVIAGRGNDTIRFYDSDSSGPPVNCGPGFDTVINVDPGRTLIDCEEVD